MKHIRTFLLLTLACMTAICFSFFLFACDKQPETVTYTVTVSCEDGPVPAGVGVRLEKDGVLSGEKPLSGGKASFELEAAVYTVTLSGLPADYLYQPTTLTPDAPDAAVTLTKQQTAPPPAEKITYTVTVSCEDGTALSAVKVRIMKGDTSVAEAALENGKASFSLDAGNYTAILAGAIPAGYTYESKSLSAASPNATITLTKKTASVAAEITVKLAAGKDVFGTDRAERSLADARVDLYLSETDLSPVASARSDANGVAHFERLDLGSYLVSVNGRDCGALVLRGESATVTLRASLGSAVAPLPWVVGENSLPFTQQVLETLGEESVSCTLTVSESGLYSFDADNRNVNIKSDLFELVADEHAVAELTAGVAYSFSCTSGGENGGAYTVTVAKGDTHPPVIPWEGAGTESDPYRVTSLTDVYELRCNPQSEIFFRYTATESKHYVLSLEAGSSALVFRVGGTQYKLSGVKTEEFSLAAGEVLFSVSPDGGAGGLIALRFRIAEKASTDPGPVDPDPDKPDPDNPDPDNPDPDNPDPDKPDPDKPDPDNPDLPEPDGTREHPYLITTLLGAHENIFVEYTGVQFKDVYYRYLPEEDGKYTMTLTVPGDAVISLSGASPIVGQISPYLNPAHLSVDFQLTAGTPLIICISGGNDEEDSANYASFTCAFTVSAYVEPEAEPGSAHNPIPLGELLGTHVIEQGMSCYYLYRSSAAGKYSVSTAHRYGITFTVRTELVFDKFGVPTGAPYYRTELVAGSTDVFELEAGKDYYISVSSNYDPDGGFSPEGGSVGPVGSVDFTVGIWTPGEPDGTRLNPYPLENLFDEHTFNDVDEAGVYYTFTLTEETKITVTAQTIYFCLQFNNLARWQVTKQGSSKTFTLPAGSVTLHIWFPGGTGTISFTVEKAAAASVSANGTARPVAMRPEPFAQTDRKRGL